MDREFLERGLTLFRQRDYFGAHEEWEDGWRPLGGDRRRFWQAMIQLAVGAHHYSQGNLVGARNLWRKAHNRTKELCNAYPGHGPIHALEAALDRALTALHDHENPLPLVEEFGRVQQIESWTAAL